MRTYGTAHDRWAGVGPYYAMFPVHFANEVIREHSDIGDTVLDPFAGRGTSLFSAASQGRHALGAEINPAGWIYTKTKLSVAPRKQVEQRLAEIDHAAGNFAAEVSKLPQFFSCCFHPDVAGFLLAARDLLNWKRHVVDRTLMALLLINLHGHRRHSLSNQMRQTKSMSPPYAIRWWEERDLHPPAIDPVKFMLNRIAWRYAKGRPHVPESHVYLGDSRYLLNRVWHRTNRGVQPKAKLLFTSPPYYDITNYNYDQWLRLWLLKKGPADASTIGHAEAGIRHSSKARYRYLIHRVFRESAMILEPDAHIYVRTDRRSFTREVTQEALLEVFPDKRLSEVSHPPTFNSQTRLFQGEECAKASPGEVDFILE